MDPATIITTAMAVLTPFVKKGVAEFGRAAGQAACDRAQQLLEFIKGQLAGDKTASDNLATFETKPDVYKPVIEDTLKEKLATDPGFARELEQRLKEMGPQLDIILKISDAKNVTGLDADTVAGGKVNVSITSDKGDNVTGARIGRIG